LNIQAIPEVQELAARVRGEVVTPGHEEYDEARQVWNALIDKYPALIVRCAGVADVLNTVQYARTHNLMVAVRGGGHNVAGNATCDGGMLVNFLNNEGQERVRAAYDPKTYEYLIALKNKYDPTNFFASTRTSGPRYKQPQT